MIEKISTCTTQQIKELAGGFISSQANVDSFSVLCIRTVANKKHHLGLGLGTGSVSYRHELLSREFLLN
jgi:hypothetical protein